MAWPALCLTANTTDRYATDMTMEYYRHIMDVVGTSVDGIGVFVIIGGALLATVGLALRALRNTGNYYSLYRQDVGRAILLGLEFLIAGDIIRTVVVAPTIQNVLALGLIVLIRTFLSLSLQLEIEGKLPWRREAPR
jgi:uncharacterized membrane protein